MLGPDQLNAVRAAGVIPSFFVAHTYHWGDAHIELLGLDRAQNISPLKSAENAGIRFTLHQDAPIIAPDMLETVWCAVMRTTKTGVVLGPHQRISVTDALRSVTMHAAAQYGEPNKGCLAPGKTADFVLLSENPAVIPPENITKITVLATAKNGRIVYSL